MPADDLIRWAARRGYGIAWGPMSFVQVVREDLAARIRDRQLDRDFSDKWLSNFRFPEGASNTKAQSVLLPSIPTANPAEPARMPVLRAPSTRGASSFGQSAA
jgi:hypothetical protein